MKKIFPITASMILCEAVGLVSTPFTISAIAGWYQFLHKPFFSPPNWLFGPVWTVLYACMGIALYLVWSKGSRKKTVNTAIQLFLVQLGFNFLWSLLFFGLRSPILGLADIFLLLTFIVFTMRAFLPLSKTAFYLLVPYLAWVSFATLLNLAIVLLNP